VRFLLFDVKPWPDAMGRYLDIAASLRPEVDLSGGCEYLDRYRRLAAHDADGGWLLSFQYWQDEKSMVRWRKNITHHQAQEAGRDTVFEDYRVRVGEVLREKTPSKPVVQRAKASVNADTSFVILIESKSDAVDAGTLDPTLRFESIYRPGSFLLLGNTPRYEDALRAFDLAEKHDAVSHVTIGAVDRDYGMFDRSQAPQAFPQH
jgi:heme-degrading monooxygenase HmoA